MDQEAKKGILLVVLYQYPGIHVHGPHSGRMTAQATEGMR